MKVLGYDPYIGQEMALSYGAHLTSLDEIYATADFIRSTPILATRPGT